MSALGDGSTEINTPSIAEHPKELIDLGPGAGDKGGGVVATGTPEQVARIKRSHTGQWLKGVLARDGVPPSTGGSPKGAKAGRKAPLRATTQEA